MSRYFPSFAARGGTEKLPLIGPISQSMDCIYVEREARQAGTKGVATLVKERMQASASGQGKHLRPMLLFPEGTTTNGNFLLPFKTGAFLAGVPVQPVILKYGKGRVSPAWESISAPRHIFLMFATPFHSITAYELPVYVPTEEEQKDPVLYAHNVREYMLRYSGLKPSSALLADKRAYHAKLKGEALPASKKVE
ncbi:probable lysophosphatidylcholine acyltransferase 1 [Coccomyxa sp. Obi]|nr:probable lysophosphatidylcholine acyltransferase 1 [Coccomyxa sp. Obi]